MRRPLGRSAGVTAWFRGLGVRITIGFLLILGVAFLILSRLDNPFVNDLKSGASDLAAPVLDVLGWPVEKIRDTGDWIGDLWTVNQENQRLKAENTALRQWQQVAQRLDLENRRLSALLNAKLVRPQTIATARVVGVAGGPFVRSVLINAGSDLQIAENLAVIAENGIVGRVIRVGASSARVLLITDLNSRIPVRIERTSQNGILIGLNMDRLELDFLPIDRDVVVGDWLVTSGHGGIFPPDFPIGIVREINGDRITVTPVASLDTLDFVQVLDYAIPQIEIEAESGVEPEEEQP